MHNSPEIKIAPESADIWRGETVPEESLPIYSFREEIKEYISKNPVTIIVGETGSGKSTQLPLMIREVMGKNDKAAITQPRRVATRSVSKYVADKVGCELGDEVGYQIRFDDHTTAGTRINFMTDGLLLRKMQADPLLSEFSTVMVDEAHERSENIDVTLGLLSQVQKERRERTEKPLSIIVTSATMEKEKFSKFFDDAPVIEIPGRLFPVNIHYEKRRPVDYMRRAAEVIQEIEDNNKTGDILVFMPGKAEIDRTIHLINDMTNTDAHVMPLFADMAAEDQDKIFEKTEKRKIIVATNIAETSITLPEVKYVIDSGVIKQKEFDPVTGIARLVPVEHAQSGCVQRAGRAGRVAEGDCYRLYTEENFASRKKFQIPEIQRSNLNGSILRMIKIGIQNVETFPFIDAPDRMTISRAIDTLKILGALDKDRNLTEMGNVMAEIPLEPHVSRMLIEASKPEYQCMEPVATIASFIDGKNVFLRPIDEEFEADEKHAAFKERNSDFMTYLNIWEAFQRNNYDESWANENYLNSKILSEVKNVREQLFEILDEHNFPLSKRRNKDAIGRSITSGLIQNLLVRDKDGDIYRLLHDRYKTPVFIHPSSTMRDTSHEYLIAADVIETKKVFARTCQEADPDSVRAFLPQPKKENKNKNRKNGRRVDIYSRNNLHKKRHH